MYTINGNRENIFIAITGKIRENYKGALASNLLTEKDINLIISDYYVIFGEVFKRISSLRNIVYLSVEGAETGEEEIYNTILRLVTSVNVESYSFIDDSYRDSSFRFFYLEGSKEYAEDNIIIVKEYNTELEGIYIFTENTYNR